MNRELPGVQAEFRKAGEPEIKLPTSAGSWKKQESSRKTPISALLTMPPAVLLTDGTTKALSCTNLPSGRGGILTPGRKPRSPELSVGVE